MTSTCATEGEQATIARDIPCVGCGYNLRTLSTTGVCPECAHSVEDSLRFFREDSLWVADPGWLRRLRRGTTLMLVAAVGFMGSLVLTVCVMLFPPPVRAWAPYVIVVGFLAAAGVWCVGVFGVTSLQPGIEEVRRRKAGRWVARVCAFAPLAIWLYMFVFMVLVTLYHAPEWLRPPEWLYRLTYGMSLAAPFFSPLTVSLYCRPLGRRGHQLRLSRLNAILACLLGVGLAMWGVPLALTLGMGVSLGMLVVLGALLPLLASFVLGIWSFVGHRRMFGTILRTRSM